MTILFHAMELLATFLETFIIFSLTAVLTKKSRLLMRIILSCLLTGFVTYLNSFTMFSNYTQAISILLVAPLLILIFKVKPVVSFTLVLFYFEIIYIFDFSALEILQLLYGNSILKAITAIGFTRFLFLLIMKTILVASFFVVKKVCSNKKIWIGNQYCKWLLLCGLFSYACMWFTTDSVFSNNLWRIKISIIIDWAFMFLFIITIMLITYWMTKTQHERDQNQIIAIRNQLLESNYKTMHALYAENAQNYHDFNNHLLAIRELIRSNQIQSALTYTDQIAKPMQLLAQKTWSGIDVVDAIINDKYQRCVQSHISIHVSAKFPPNIQIEAQDICAILANLLDNSIEACMTLPRSENRSINFIVQPVNNMLIIKVENTVKENPLLENKNLFTTKNNKTLHGWGMQSIRAAVNKYSGFIEHLYKPNRFITMITIPL